MKNICIAVCVLFLTHVVSASTCEVEELREQPSSRDVQITVLGAKAPKNVRVEVYPYEEGRMVFPDVWGDIRPRFSVPVDHTKGEVRLPRLAEGHYVVVARAEQALQATLYLGILPDAGNKTSTFSMRLSNCAVAESPSEMLARAEQMPIKDRVRVFDGVAYDPSGAVIVGAAIHVVRKGTQGKDRVAALKSDAAGHFSAQLHEGFYIAFFSKPGFHTTITPFEVTNDGSSELRIMLQLAQTT